MNYYWKVSVVILMVLNVALAGAFFYQSRNASPFDDTRLGAIGSKLKGELENASKAARKYSDDASAEASKQLTAFAAKVEESKADMGKKFAALEDKIHRMEKEAKK